MLSLISLIRYYNSTSLCAFHTAIHMLPFSIYFDLITLLFSLFTAILDPLHSNIITPIQCDWYIPPVTVFIHLDLIYSDQVFSFTSYLTSILWFICLLSNQLCYIKISHYALLYLIVSDWIGSGLFGSSYSNLILSVFFSLVNSNFYYNNLPLV